MKVFYLYPDSIPRKQVYEKNKPFTNEFYILYGRDVAAKYGFCPIDDFDICEKIENSSLGKLTNFALNKVLTILGGEGGAWFKVWKLRQRIKQAYIILSIADRVGIPLVLLKYLGLIPDIPIIYISIGLPERLEKLSPRMFVFYKKVFAKTVKKIVCYGYEESLKLKKIFGDEKVKFIPLGADVKYFKSSNDPREGDYILFSGADPNRDFDLLLNIAASIKCKILIITTKRRMAELKKKRKILPKNISILLDVPFLKIKKIIANSKFVILPVKENSYSGATTTLLQTMAMGKAVIVSQTGAIREGYYLENNKNCILIEPGDRQNFLEAVKALLNDKEKRRKLGENAKTMVNQYLSWDIFLEKLFSLLSP